MKWIFCCVILILLYSSLLGNQKVDSILKSLATIEKDSLKYSQLLDIAVKCMIDDKELADTLLKIAENYYESINDKNGLARTFNFMGNMERYKYQNYKALKFYYKALKINEELGNQEEILNNYGNLSHMMSELEEYEKSLEYTEKTYHLSKSLGNNVSKCFALLDFGFIYFKMNNFEKSLEYFFRAKDLAFKFDIPNGKLFSLDNIAEVYYYQNKLDESLMYCKLALDIGIKINNNFVLANTFTRIGNIYLKKTEFDLAVDNFSKGKIIAQRLNLHDKHQEILYGLSTIYSSQGKFSEAYKLRIQADSLKDSLFNIEKINALKNVQQKYEIEKVQNEIELLKKEDQISEIQFFWLFILLAVILVLFFVILIRFREKKKHNLILTNKNIEIEQRNQDLNNLNSTKDKFFTIISHDLRGPLGSFKSITEHLYDEYNNIDESDRLELLEVMKNSSDSIFKLLENLLVWSRSQRGVIPFNPEDFAIHYLVDNIIQFLSLSLKEKKITVENNISPDTVIFADINMMTTILRNLVSNAIKFSHEHGIIQIIHEKNTGYDLIKVKDFGIGISKDNIDKLFRVDVNFTSLGTSNEKGTGLGLILCKELVEKHGGTIWVDSVLGEGSEFTFSIPEK